MPDDAVDIKFSADHQGAQTALEQIAAALQKIGEAGKRAGSEQKEGMNWASEGLEEFTGKLTAAFSAGALFEKGIETINEGMERLAKLAEDAKHSLDASAGSEHSWLDIMAAGSADPAQVRAKLDKIAFAAGATRQGADQTLAAAMQANAQWGGAPIEAELEQTRAALATTPAGATAAARAGQIARLQHFAPELTAEGAGDVLARTGWSGKPERSLELLMGAKVGGGFSALEGFSRAVSAGISEEVDPQSLLRSVQAIVKTAEQQGRTGKGDLGAALNWFQHTDAGQRAAKRMDWTEIAGGGKGAAGGAVGRNAALSAFLPQLLAPDFQLPRVEANDPETRERNVSFKEAADRLRTQDTEARSNRSKLSHDIWLESTPEGIQQQAKEAYAKVQQTFGFGEWLEENINNFPIGYPKTDPERELTYDIGLTKQHLQILKGAPQSGETQKTIEDTQTQLNLLQQLVDQLKGLREESARPQDLRILSGGDEHRAAAVPAGAAGR